MSNRPRTLPCKYFYDERGSQLFEQICRLDEYYVTRTELAIMQQHAASIARRLGPRVMLVEYGSGSSIKTRVLLDQLINPAVCMLIDISRDHLLQTARSLAEAYPQIEVVPVCADFCEKIRLPSTQRTPERRVVYFPGSTIGNFKPGEGRALLSRIAELAGSGGGLLIGIDLEKDEKALLAAYNDSQGITAEFNLNLLRRINDELQADFQLDQFAHRAVYDREQHRIEMQLISRSAQVVNIGGRTFEFAPQDIIRTEYSHKYRVDRFAEMASDAGLTYVTHWSDSEPQFAVVYLVVE